MNGLVISLCCGLQGATQTFIDYEVVSIDIDIRVFPTIVADVRYLPLRPGLRPRRLIMTPPCRYLSEGDWAFPRPGIKADLEVVGACLEAVPYLMPAFWVLENPEGHLRKFMPSKKVLAKWKSYDMKKNENLWTNRPRELYRAFWPEEASLAIQKTMEATTS